jgi:hypothetical protein
MACLKHEVHLDNVKKFIYNFTENTLSPLQGLTG